jgi:pilus assembly protein CpaE
MNRVLVAGRAGEYVAQVERLIASFGCYDTATNVMTNGTADPLDDPGPSPSVLVLVLSSCAAHELRALVARSATTRVPLIVIGEALDPKTMRLAMQAGARDFLSPDTDTALLEDALRVLTRESVTHATANGASDTRQTVVVNAAGGNGATTIAVNLAHHFATTARRKTAIVDLDLQFAPVGQHLDLTPARSLLEALERIDELDREALDGYLTPHASGVALMSATTPSETMSHDELDPVMGRLLALVRGAHERVIVDLPNRIDGPAASVLETSDDILLVLQQNLTSVRNAARMVEIIRRHLAIPDNHITLVVNRYHKNAAIELADIKHAVKAGPVFTIPNQFRSIAQGIELGVPFMKASPGSAAGRAIVELATHVGGEVRAQKHGFIGKTLSSLLGV